MQIIAVAVTIDGERVEATLTLPDSAGDVMHVGNALERSRIKLQQAANTAAENLGVARQDHAAQRRRDEEFLARVTRGEKQPPRGPDQIAFAGTKEPAVEVPNTGTHTHKEALRLAGWEEATVKGTKVVRRIGKRE